MTTEEVIRQEIFNQKTMANESNEGLWMSFAKTIFALDDVEDDVVLELIRLVEDLDADVSAMAMLALGSLHLMRKVDASAAKEVIDEIATESVKSKFKAFSIVCGLANSMIGDEKANRWLTEQRAMLAKKDIVMDDFEFQQHYAILILKQIGGGWD